MRHSPRIHPWHRHGSSGYCAERAAWADFEAPESSVTLLLEASEAGKLVEAAGQRIAVFNVRGKYWAIEDTCPHRGGPLSEGMLAEDEVICPWHGSRFNLKTGAVLTPPAQRNVKSFPVRIVGTDVEVEIE